MGAIEETRQLLQDFLAPEILEITARLGALEKRFGGIARKINSSESSLDARAEVRHEIVMAAISRIAVVTEVKERLARLESREVAHQ